MISSPTLGEVSGGNYFRDSFHTIPTYCVVRNEKPECEPAASVRLRQVKAKVRLM